MKVFIIIYNCLVCRNVSKFGLLKFSKTVNDNLLSRFIKVSDFPRPVRLGQNRYNSKKFVWKYVKNDKISWKSLWVPDRARTCNDFCSGDVEDYFHLWMSVLHAVTSRFFLQPIAEENCDIYHFKPFNFRNCLITSYIIT